MQTKARSRLQQQHTQIKDKPLVFSHLPQIPLLRKVNPGYLRHWPLFAATLLSTGALLFFVTAVSPRSIAHLLFPNSYLPFLLLFFITSFFWFSYLFLNTKRGVTFAYAVSFIIFSKLQQVSIDVGTLAVAATLIALPELFWLLSKMSFFAKNPNLKKRGV